MGKGPLAGRSHHLAGRQAHHSAGRRSSGEFVVQQHSVVCRQRNVRNASARPHRAVQCTARSLQVRCVSVAEENGRIRGQFAFADVRCASDRAERRAGQVYGSEQGGTV